MPSLMVTIVANVVLAAAVLLALGFFALLIANLDVSLYRMSLSFFRIWPPVVDSAPVFEHTQQYYKRAALIVRAEIAFAFLLQPVGCVMVLVVGWTLREKFTSYVAAIAILFMVRSKAVEAMLIRWHAVAKDGGDEQSGQNQSSSGDSNCSVLSLFAEDLRPVWTCRLPKMKAIGGALKILDAMSDGMCIGLAILLDETIHDNFCKSFGSGVFWWMSSVANALHLWGIMSIVLLMSTLLQAAFGTAGPAKWKSEESAGVAVLSEANGFYLLMERVDYRDAGEKNTSLAFNVLAEVCMEQAPQLKLQLSLLMAQGLGVLEQPAVLLSVIVGCLTMTGKGFKVLFGAHNVYSFLERLSQRLLAMAIFLFVGYIVASLVMMEYCEDHLWGLTTGCVITKTPPTVLS